MKARVVLLAAGKGTRMRSRTPKLLHPLGGKPMILHSLEAVKALADELPLLVVGHGSDEMRTTVSDRAEFVQQNKQLGTGHALLQTKGVLAGKVDLVLVSNADLPLLTTETFKLLLDAQQKNKGPLTMLTSNKKRRAVSVG